jgi:hypothetical protein
MVAHNPPSPAESACLPVIPLPIALMSPMDSFLRSMTEDSPTADFQSAGRGSFPGRTTSQRQLLRVRKRTCTHTKTSASGSMTRLARIST